MACVSDDAQWLCMVTLFVASVATLLVYFVQYFYGRGGSGHAGPVPEEAGALLNWALSQRSWKSQWRRAWFRTLNERAAETANSVRLIFEEDGLQSSDLVLDQVCSFRKSPGQKAMCCRVVGEKLQFSLSAAQPNSSAEPLRYSVKVSPLHLQLDLQMTEADGDVRLNWGLSGLDSSDLQLVPSFVQGGAAGLSVHAVRDKLRQILCDVRPSVALSSRPAQAAELKEAHSKAPQVSSPPKPPRAHEWKLLVKNIRVTWQQEGSAAGGMNPQCVLQLDDPPQKLTSSVLTGTSTPSWDQPFIFELSGRSKELNIQLMDQGKPQESSLIGQVSVPFDLVKKQPKGQHSFELMTKDEVVGSLTTEFTYLEPSEVRTWQAPTPAVTKRVEMDRTVMPCGTVVTTITAVKSKPGRPLPSGLSETLLKPASKTKLAERRVSEQPSLVGATVSKALSSSDTELLMLNGTDPVAEAAIRQLQQSAKLKMKSPVKKSTIIISGVAKAPLSQDEELALMAGYAASMDASMSGGPEVIQAAPTPPMLEANSMEPLDPLEGPSHGAMMEDWESQHGEDQDMDKTSLSLCISETSSKKGKEEASDNQKLMATEQLPSQECQAVLPEEAPAQGPGHEPVAQRPGVPGAPRASRAGGTRTPDGHPTAHYQPKALAQGQEQSQRLCQTTTCMSLCLPVIPASPKARSSNPFLLHQTPPSSVQMPPLQSPSSSAEFPPEPSTQPCTSLPSPPPSPAPLPTLASTQSCTDQISSSGDEH